MTPYFNSTLVRLKSISSFCIIFHTMGEQVCLKNHPPAQGGRSSSQQLQGCHRGERAYRAFYHTGI